MNGEKRQRQLVSGLLVCEGWRAKRRFFHSPITNYHLRALSASIGGKIGLMLDCSFKAGYGPGEKAGGSDAFGFFFEPQINAD